MLKSALELCHFVEIDPQQIPIDLNSDFPVKVPLHFANQIEKGNRQDPLLKQVLPLTTQTSSTYTLDPVGDLKKSPVPSLIHKYQGRALLMASPRCDIHCRYCFRQHFPYEQVKQQNWLMALQQIQTDQSIEEVILSGGDPFSLNEKSLVDLAKKIETIAHISILRIHSRTPIATPDKAPKTEFIDWVKKTRLQIVLVVHCNHANELSETTAELMRCYKNADITLLNQSVLLQDINDSPTELKTLSQSLFAQGVLPYYCHLLDKVSGAENYEVSTDRAWQIFDELRKQLPGYLVPRLVKEIAGAPYKKVIY